MDWPEWWEWDLDFSSHADKRMSDRVLSEPELRAMLGDATRIVEQRHGTYIVEAFNDGRRWEIIVAPDNEKRVIVVVSAYPDP